MSPAMLVAATLAALWFSLLAGRGLARSSRHCTYKSPAWWFLRLSGFVIETLGFLALVSILFVLFLGV